MVLPAGDCGYVCVVPIWLQDLLVVGGLGAAIGTRRPSTSATCQAPGFRVVA
jgi:hypothetical protein